MMPCFVPIFPVRNWLDLADASCVQMQKVLCCQIVKNVCLMLPFDSCYGQICTSDRLSTSCQLVVWRQTVQGVSASSQARISSFVEPGGILFVPCITTSLLYWQLQHTTFITVLVVLQRAGQLLHCMALVWQRVSERAVAQWQSITGKSVHVQSLAFSMSSWETLESCFKSVDHTEVDGPLV